MYYASELFDASLAVFQRTERNFVYGFLRGIDVVLPYASYCVTAGITICLAEQNEVEP